MYHPVVAKIKSLLEERKIPYDYFEHEAVRTSEQASKTRAGYNLKQGTKALIVKIYMRGGTEKFVMLVVSGDARFDSKKVKKELDARDLRFATEEEVGEVTGGVLVGGVPPFGSLFGIQTYLDLQVEENDRVVFNAGDRCVSVGMALLDYLAIEKPLKANIVQTC